MSRGPARAPFGSEVMDAEQQTRQIRSGPTSTGCPRPVVEPHGAAHVPGPQPAAAHRRYRALPTTIRTRSRRPRRTEGAVSDERLTYRFGPLERRGIFGPLGAGQAGVLGLAAVAAIVILDASPTRRRRAAGDRPVRMRRADRGGAGGAAERGRVDGGRDLVRPSPRDRRRPVPLASSRRRAPRPWLARPRRRPDPPRELARRAHPRRRVPRALDRRPRPSSPAGGSPPCSPAACWRSRCSTPRRRSAGSRGGGWSCPAPRARRSGGSSGSSGRRRRRGTSSSAGSTPSAIRPCRSGERRSSSPTSS